MEAARPFAAWSDFYVIVGSAAAALTGLQFVVIVLSTELRMGTGETTGAFATPTVVHFCSVLLISAVMTGPWPPVVTAAVPVILGAAGVVYAVVIARRARAQTQYKPVFEDWLFHFALPLVGYAAMAAGGALVRRAPTAAGYTLGGISLLLLFVGIHNAWDAVTYVAQHGREPES